MQVFDVISFLEFIGEPVYCNPSAWGREYRYVVSENSLLAHETLLKNTILHHHSSFDFSEEVIQLSYPLAAKALSQRNSGNPNDDRTRMGNLGEVIGAEFSKACLGFETTRTFPKRLNPNIDQSMKGVDIIGLRNRNHTAELLIGEAKSAKQYDKRLIEEAYEHLVDLETKEASQFLRFMKEVFTLQNDRQELANIDRHMAKDVQRQYLILFITQSTPEHPFASIEGCFKSRQIPNLSAVHIQISDLKNAISKDKQYEIDGWLPKIFNL
ncbi:MAG: hypothetical protein WAV74_17200 [Anaerolineae bacterium]